MWNMGYKPDYLPKIWNITLSSEINRPLRIWDKGPIIGGHCHKSATADHVTRRRWYSKPRSNRQVWGLRSSWVGWLVSCSWLAPLTQLWKEQLKKWGGRICWGSGWFTRLWARSFQKAAENAALELRGIRTAARASGIVNFNWSQTERQNVEKQEMLDSWF